MGVRSRQFNWLVWKNFILQIRRPIGTGFEILVPLALVALLVVARVGLETTFDQDMCFATYEPTSFRTDEDFREFPIALPPLPTGLPFPAPSDRPDLPFDELICNLTSNCGELAWYPQTELTTRLMLDVSRIMQLSLTELVFESEEDMVKIIAEDYEKFYAAVVFDFPANDSALPLITPYRIRISSELSAWFTGLTYPYYILTVPLPLNAYDDRFLELQHAIDYTIMEFQSEQHGTPEKMFGLRREVQRFPYPQWRVETFLSSMQFLMPIIMCLSLIYSAGSITKELVLEKETRMKESMKMMGLSNWLHWSAWFVKCFLFLMISGFVMSIFLKAGEVFRYSDYGCTLLLLVLWITAGIMWNFAISVLFSKAKIAMVVAIIFWYLNYVCVEFLLIDYFGIPTNEKIAACLLHNTCLGVAIQTISRLESLHVGMTWQTLMATPAEGYDVPIAAVYVMFCVDCIVYGLFAWYVEAVFPGEYGIPKPFYFPFQKSYWFGPDPNDAKSTKSIDEMELGDDPSVQNHEPDPVGMKAGITIQNLRKVFESSVGTKVAVDNLTLNMFEDQITSLLGHNGAGKTTTMSMLTGLFPPTAGTARVNGFDIVTDMDSIRQSLGLCPQHNILFDRLTVKEHLKFFLGLKGIVGEEAEAYCTDMINDLKLVDKTNSQSSQLSGGMKRKLSVGIALIGRPKVVLLDEPTSGMDPYARRSTWDLLLKHKHGKTFILTTHSMDEADLLGDRIAIMARGNLICSGSSLFLKNKYGVGYHLVLVKQPDCNVGEVDNRIHSFVPKAELTSESGAELSYTLPRENTSVFTSMCKYLEDNRRDLGIASFGISVTTLEEVFLKVDQLAEEEAEDFDPLMMEMDGKDNFAMDGGAVSNGEIPETKEGGRAHLEKDILPDEMDTEKGDFHANGKANGSTANILRPDETEVNMDQNAYEQEGILTGVTLKWLQFKAIFIKRLLHSKRDKKAIITQLVVPLVFVLFGLLLLVLVPYFGDDPPRTLTLHNMSRENEDAFTYFADLRMGPDDRDILKYLPDSVRDQGLAVRDITQEALDIQRDNTGKLMNGNEITDRLDCCGYEFQVLNQNCSQEIHDSVNEETNLCSEYKDFGYYHCPYCVDNPGYYDRDHNDSCPVGTDTQMLDYMNTYYEEYILRESSVGGYFNDLVAGFTLTEDKNNTNTTLVIAWYSNQPMHANAESLAVLDNALLQYFTNSSYQLVVTNHPLPGSSSEQVSDEAQQSMILAICAVFGLGFLSASFAPFLIHEKASKSKLLQFVSGLDPLSYWFGTILWDAINYGIVLILLVILFGIFPTVYAPPHLGETTLLLVLYGWASIPMVYSLSWPFSSPLAGYGLIALLLAMGSMVTIITVFILELLDHTQEAAVICDYIFNLLPTHCLGRAMIFMALNIASIAQCTGSQIDRQVCESSGIEFEENILAWNQPGVGQHCLYLFLEGVFWMAMTLLIEVNFFVPARSPKYLASADYEGEDEDVAQERHKVNAMLTPETSGHAVVLTNLTKVYSGTFDNCRKKTRDPAVDHLCLTIPKGECFGLLGINGAGKTSTFSMMTGDLSISAGTAYMGGYNIQREKRQVQQRIGYCPQFDALVEKLTGRELLRMYARLRGIPSHMIEAVVESCIRHIYLGNWADKICGNYSGGNKRKLSTAIAMVGNPPIIFLDEPTAGMDPRARRFLWNSITRLMKGGRCIVLTSHSMEECEALCTRMAIMVNGQFKCLGSTQHLKSRFGSGYSMMVKVEPTGDTTAIKEFIASKFPGATLLEEHLGMIQYRIDSTNLSWSYIFGTIEDNKAQFELIDYSVSQTSLEQVFIDFAKDQNVDERNT
ncbi:phospholipid-transporting ATPase ABCA3-like isoform X2 [Ptychodera flava]|uniref:phospholipid-transporting ATPase ABCA3-like isoform X2 n=1 Tax=Ptychodera flava TaxID=63121 RepID=UPI00396A05C3